MYSQPIEKKPVPAEIVEIILKNGAVRSGSGDGKKNKGTVVIQIGEIATFLEGNLSEYAAYRSYNSDCGEVTFDHQQLLRDAGMLPRHIEAHTVTSDGRINESGKQLGS